MGLLTALLLLATAQDAVDLLEASCVKCHDASKKKGGLDLSTREGLLKGGDAGAAVVPGRAKASLLHRVVTHETEPRMPHKAPKLPAEAAGTLAAWIDEGAPYARPLKSTAKEELHWAFRPLRRPEPPAGPGSPVDRFIESALRARGLSLNAPADPLALLRRASFDLVGLPPSPEEIGTAEDWDTLVDRLLASPHYGERWGRHWLDLARYADSSGYESDFDRKNSHHYRDFVIRALNDDLPFDVFVRWQVAGDELEPANPQAVAATGFCAVGPYQKTLPTDTERNKAIYRNDALDDVVSTAASAFLGLTLGCARCHDHKYDPISQRDYYRLTAVFAPAERKERSLSLPRRRLEEWLESKREAFKRSRIDALPLTPEEKLLLGMPEDGNIVSSKRVHREHGARIRFTDDDLRARLPEEDRRAWERLDREAAGASAPKALALGEPGGEPCRSWLLGRGDPDSRNEEVQPGFLSVLTPDPSPRFRPPGPETSFRRAAFAAWLTDVERGAGGLLARVIVNRLWQHHFGEGLVRTPSDFGIQGERPTHPELLDWLASELVRDWSLKRMHRLLMTSAAYRQDTAFDARKAAADPENRLWGRRRPKRLEAEILRDALLASSGRLDPALYGPAVRAPIPKEAIVTRTKDAYPADLKDGPAAWRRSIYLFVKRSVLVPMMETFDVPSASAGCGRRERTTVAPQALALLNDPFVRGCARDLARRAGGPDRAWLLALGRPPKASEREAAEEFLRSGPLEDLCHALFTLNEFLYVD